MTCNCSLIKTNLANAGIYGTAKLIMTKEGKPKKKDSIGDSIMEPVKNLRYSLIKDITIFGAIGFTFDNIKTMPWYQPIHSVVDDQVVKSGVQLVFLTLAESLMYRRFRVSSLLNDSLAIAVTNYGYNMLQ
jgi:hypothetical protein